jgi:hypothetical protein
MAPYKRASEGAPSGADDENVHLAKKVARPIIDLTDETPETLATNDDDNKKSTTSPRSFDGNPMKPREDPLAVDCLIGQQAMYILYMAIREAPSEGFAQGLATCARTCNSHAVHQACFQRDGTRHVTLWDGVLTDRAASALAFPADLRASFTAVPIAVQ